VSCPINSFTSLTRNCITASIWCFVERKETRLLAGTLFLSALWLRAAYPCNDLPPFNFQTRRWASNMKIGLIATWSQAHFSASAGYPGSPRCSLREKHFRLYNQSVIVPSPIATLRWLSTPPTTHRLFFAPLCNALVSNAIPMASFECIETLGTAYWRRKTWE
jgi:hypothetical protein